jgi:ADP-heptose:LPS heptosyltransferase
MEQFGRLGDNPQRVGLVRALRGLGDLLVMVPALRALRAALPRADISLIGLPSGRAFVQRYPHYLDHFIEFPGFPGIPEVPFDAPRFKNWLASSPAQRFDLVLQMHGNGLVINGFVEMLGAPRTAGFYLPGFHCPDPERFLPYPSTEPELWRLLRLMEFLGISLKGDYLEFPLLAGDWLALAAIKAATPGGDGPGSSDLVPQQYVVLHPGAFEPARRWPPKRFAQVADALAARGLQVVVTGTGDEMEAAAALVAAAATPVVNLAGRTNLGALAALLSQARMLISNDTGVSHLAAALRVPSVIVFLASDPIRWAPQDRRLHRTVGAQPVVTGIIDDSAALALPVPGAAANPCDRRCLRDACRCLVSTGVTAPPTVDAVLSEALALLGEVTYAG